MTPKTSSVPDLCIDVSYIEKQISLRNTSCLESKYLNRDIGKSVIVKTNCRRELNSIRETKKTKQEDKNISTKTMTVIQCRSLQNCRVVSLLDFYSNDYYKHQSNYFFIQKILVKQPRPISVVLYHYSFQFRGGRETPANGQ